jgi:Putative adhesin
MRSSPLLLVAVAGAALLARPLAGQTQNEFHWKGKLAQGKTIWVKGINGRVSAALGSGDVEVSAVKRARRSDPDEVKIEVVEHDDGVTICAVYPSYGRHENTCEFGEHSHSDVHDNDVEVDFTVSVPAGVRFSGSTVNGSVDAANLASDVEAHTVNGGIRVSTSGYAEATTVNGSIVASLGRSNWTNSLEFHTVNGGITLDLPAGLSTEVRASTVNGDIITDFPLTVTGRFGPRHVNGTIGSGGRELTLETVNGSITLRKTS